MSKKLETLEGIDVEIKALQERKLEAKEDYLKEVCPLKVGEKTAVKGCAHRGKMMEVTSLHMKQDWDDEYYWKARGTIIKKNGELGQYAGEVDQRSYKGGE